MSGDREANLLGALALAVNDHAERAIAEHCGQAPSAAAALAALLHILEKPSIDQLRAVLGLSHSGAVRLVDRLEGARLVKRGPSDDGRSRIITLTARGRRSAAALSARREKALAALLDGFTPDERKSLHRLMGRLMENLVWSKEGGAWICRMCDLAACRRAAGECPTANAARAKYGAPGPGDE